jgi:hypothetical protein
VLRGLLRDVDPGLHVTSMPATVATISSGTLVIVLRDMWIVGVRGLLRNHYTRVVI